VGGIIRRISRLLDPVTLRVAGSRWFPLWAILRHSGRRSGRSYATPIVARRTADGFIVPMPFSDAQWSRNVLAAGHATIRWKDREYETVEPTVVDLAAAADALGRINTRFARAAGVDRYMKLRDAPVAQEAPVARGG
jgi:deazaflavin-dependent oxidoreductase (nitroreductase family)